MIESFPLFTPNSVGSYKMLAPICIDSINRTIPELARLARNLHEKEAEIIDVERFCLFHEGEESAEALSKLFDKYGSDKSRDHNYHFVYGAILRENLGDCVVEIGIGTRHEDVVSHMGKSARPGASLRAFRDFTDGLVVGADYDRRVLFTEERIDTFFVDQTDHTSFGELKRSLPESVKLVIDDGLHSPDANLTTLHFGLEVVSPGGWVVIEDIPYAALPMWHVVFAIIPDEYRCFILRGKQCYVFAVHRE